VLRAVEELLPNEKLIYFGDSAHLPYGEKTMEEIRNFSEGVVDFLLEKKCKLIVIACNTASAAALKYLREIHPEISFVGMEPAVKPAAEQTQSGVVGVMATTATFQGELFASVVERFAQNVKVIHQPCPGLVQQIEAGKLESADTEKMLREWLEPMIEKKIDTLVLACTHYPFVLPLIKKIVGEKIRVIDPAPAIAKQVKKILIENNLLNENRKQEADAGGREKNKVDYYTSGKESDFTKTLWILAKKIGFVREVNWNEIMRKFDPD